MQRVIAVASGKGGTGKTTVATNLASVLKDTGERVAYLDCDVEEPNAHIFLKPELGSSKVVDALVPEVDLKACDGCGKCGEICQFSAIVVLNGKPLTFPELCHSCGGCSLVCPRGAITERARPQGVIERGVAGGIAFTHGKLDIGEPSAVGLIREVKQRIPAEGTILIDAPPGTSCPVIEAVKDVDYIILVTEPTPFGLNDLKLAVETVRQLDCPFGVVINRADIGDDGVTRYCENNGINVLLSIPDDRRIAEAYSRGRLAIEAVPEYREVFLALAESITEKIKN